MAKYDKEDGIPTIQERRRFPKEFNWKKKKNQGKKKWGVRLVPSCGSFRSTRYSALWDWYARCSYVYYKTERARDDALRRYQSKKACCTASRYIFEPCIRG